MVVHQRGAKTAVYPNRKAQSKSDSLNVNTQTFLCWFLLNRGYTKQFSSRPHALFQLSEYAKKKKGETGRGLDKKCR